MRIIPKEDCENNALVRIEAKYCEYEESLNISRFYLKYIRHIENVSNSVETKSTSSLYEKKETKKLHNPSSEDLPNCLFSARTDGC